MHVLNVSNVSITMEITIQFTITLKEKDII